jgi:hypothetical protein
VKVPGVLGKKGLSDDIFTRQPRAELDGFGRFDAEEGEVILRGKLGAPTRWR